jgi:transketolase
MSGKFDNVAMRDAFWDRVYEIAWNNKNVFLVSADQDAPSLNVKFRKDLPHQFVNVGIAEQNAILVAAGMALGGKKTFAYAIAPFITLRCFEQVKMELAAMKIPVTMVGVGVGYSYSDSGPTHHTLEDIAIMRLLPNMTVHSPSDSVMAHAFADMSMEMSTPNYVRLDRKTLPVLYKEGSDFSQGLSVLREGVDNELCLIATGNMVHIALEVGETVGARVVDLYTFPVNEKALLDAVAGTRQIVTMEETFLPGGVGSAVLEVLADHGEQIPVKRIGVDPKQGYCYQYGGRENLQRIHGIDKESILKAVSELQAVTV